MRLALSTTPVEDGDDETELEEAGGLLEAEFAFNVHQMTAWYQKVHSSGD